MGKTRFPNLQLMAMPHEAKSVMAAPAVCRTHGIGRASFYRWREGWRNALSMMLGISCW